MVNTFSGFPETDWDINLERPAFYDGKSLIRDHLASKTHSLAEKAFLEELAAVIDRQGFVTIRQSTLLMALLDYPLTLATLCAGTLSLSPAFTSKTDTAPTLLSTKALLSTDETSADVFQARCWVDQHIDDHERSLKEAAILRTKALDVLEIEPGPVMSAIAGVIHHVPAPANSDPTVQNKVDEDLIRKCLSSINGYTGAQRKAALAIMFGVHPHDLWPSTMTFKKQWTLATAKPWFVLAEEAPLLAKAIALKRGPGNAAALYDRLASTAAGKAFIEHQCQMHEGRFALSAMTHDQFSEIATK